MGAADGMDKVAQSSVDQIHKGLARKIRQMNQATEEKETAERKLRQAEQKAAEATGDEKQGADAKLEAAQAALTQAEAQEKMDMKAKGTAVTQAGSKKAQQALQLAAAHAAKENAQLSVKNDK